MGKRECGKCMACCTLKIEEIDKPCRTNCPHAILPDMNVLSFSGGGCGIYKDRPAICKGYECLWLRGHGEEEDRPDKSGVILELKPSGFHVHAAYEGSHETPRGAKAIDNIQKDYIRKRV